MRAGHVTGIGVLAVLVATGVAGCGGSKQAQTTSTTTPVPRPVPTLGGPNHHGAPGDKRAVVLKRRLTTAGYLVHYQPVPVPRGYSPSAATTSTTRTPQELARLRQQQLRNPRAPTPPAQILRIDITLGDKEKGLKLASELDALDATIAARGHQTIAQTQRVNSLLKSMRGLSSYELFVNIYNSRADALTFAAQQELQRQTLRDSMRANGFPPSAIEAAIASNTDFTPYTMVGTDIYVDLSAEQVGPSGYLVEPFPKAAFDKVVALAEGKAKP